MDNILKQVSREDIRYDPFPHVVLENCVPDDLYRQLAESYPDDQTILRFARSTESSKYAQNTRNDLSAAEVIDNPGIVPRLWDDFIRTHVSQEFLDSFIALFAPEIKTTYPWLERRLGKRLGDLKGGVRFSATEDSGDISLDCQIGINTPTSKPSSVRRIHTDATEELFAILLYFRHPDDASTGGDLELYEWKNRSGRIFVGEGVSEDRARLISVVPYRANTMVLFLNSEISLHAVSTRSPSPISRRLVNMVGRIYRSVPEGLFDKKQSGIAEKVINKLGRSFP